ncbi:MAG: hypothetical protein LE180_04585 [Endomicrobium sp.]|uniref:hypothetical protein n=1 Tax=Candidatus Endomicrobiellum pyrsonymphae TaxID=1408203 RepID=UPI0035834E87|nr:hypothetical protein [Endomicrobium sp.]
MMTLRLRRCVSLFVCFSLLVSACSCGKSDKKGNSVNRNSIVDAKRNEGVAAVVDERSCLKPTVPTIVTEGLGGLLAGGTVGLRQLRSSTTAATPSFLFASTEIPLLMRREMKE